MTQKRLQQAAKKFLSSSCNYKLINKQPNVTKTFESWSALIRHLLYILLNKEMRQPLLLSIFPVAYYVSREPRKQSLIKVGNRNYFCYTAARIGIIFPILQRDLEVPSDNKGLKRNMNDGTIVFLTSLLSVLI